MATANFGEGAVFEISDDMIKSMVSFDQHLERIQKSAAKINPAPFNTLVQAVNGLKVDSVQSLERLAAAMEKLSNASGAAQGINNVAQGTQNLGNSASSTNTSLSQTAQLLNQISVSRPFITMADGTQRAITNITELRDNIKVINALLNTQEQGKPLQYQNRSWSQQELVNYRNLLQQELKIQQASDEAKIASMKKVMDAQNADILLSEKKIAQARREYNETAKLKQQENYKKNTTVQGALDFSSTANTISRQITAIEYLKKARQSLDPSKDKAKIDEINNAINKHNQALQQAGVQSANLANRHRNLMDISGQLARQFALLFSVSQIQGYIGQIAKVRGEFELQQRSLEAILQNKTEADQIFQKTVDLAIKSPFQIKELVSYTKQLAAYRIEGDKLYDTTKRLADVSAGLGVDMQRLILAYGQVKAAAYLRGCLGFDTDIVMYDGSKKKVQDIFVGDLLRGDDDKPRIVKELIRGKEQMYKVSGDGYSYRVNQNHILTLFSVSRNKVVDVYVKDYLANKQDYLGVRYTEGTFVTYAISVTKDKVDNYYGFVIDQDKRFLIGDNIVTHNTEVRQFTEAGVNMYGELQSYFQEVKGEAYTTAQIVDMISKRKVTFEDVEAVFQRLTSQGGLFYNMQEIQSETLNGKIANLKDSFDVMFNSIGKANEGALKGGVDMIKNLVDNWEAVAGVAKALAGAFIAVKGSAMLMNTQLAKSVVLSYSMDRALGTGKLLSTLHLLGAGFKSLGKTIAASVGVINKAVGGIAITAVLEGLFSYFQNTSQKAENIRKINEELETQNSTINELARSYEKLQTATKKNEKGETISVISQENIDEGKKKLEKLYEEYDKRGLEVPLQIGEVSQENIDKVFNDAKEKLKNINEAIAYASRYIENDKANIEIFGTTPFSESLIEETEEYTNAIDDLLERRSDIDNALNIAGNNYDKLNDKAKSYYTEAKKLSDQYANDEITNTEYITKASEQLQLLLTTQQSRSGLGDPKYLIQFRSYLNGIKDDTTDYNNELANAQDEWRKMLNQLNNAEQIIRQLKEGKLTAKDFEVTLNEIAAKNNFSEGARIAFLAFAEQWARSMGVKGLTFKIDKEDTKAQIDWVKKEIHDSLDGTKVNIDLNFDDSFLGGLFGELDTAQKYLKNINKYKSLTKGGRTGKIYWGDAKQDADFSKWYRETWRKNNKNVKAGRISDKMEISDATINAYVGAQEKLARAELTAYNQEIEADKKNNKNRANAAAKAERDIWSERISVLKEMQQQYEKVREHYGKNTARAMVKSEFADDLAYVGINKNSYIKPEDIVPTKQGLIDALKKTMSAMPSTMKDYKKKMIELNKTISGLEMDIKTEEAQKKLDEVKRQVDNLFTGLDLHQKLKDAGLSESEVQALFPGLAKTLDDVEKGINERYAKANPDGSYLDPQTKQGAAYQEEMKKLNEQRIKEQQDLVIELTKAYKTQLSDQLQLDMWYYKERSKIASSNLTPEMKEDYNKNLKSQYNKKSASNAWNAFKGSGTYTTMFSELDYVNTDTIKRMREQIVSLKNEMQDLDPTQMKEIVDALDKMDEQLSNRNPLSSFISSMKEIKNLKAQGLTEDSMNQQILANGAENAKLQQDITAIQTIIELKQGSITQDSLEAGFLERNNSLYQMSIEKLRQMKQEKQDTINANNDQTSDYTENLKYYSGARRSLSSLQSTWGTVKSAAQNCMGNINKMLEAMGVDTDSAEMNLVNMVGTLADLAIQAIMFQMQLQLCTAAAEAMGVAMNAALGPIGWVVLALTAVTTILTSIFGNHDKALQKEIENLQRKVEALSNAYDELSDKMDAAWNIQQLQTYNKQMESNLKMQNQYLQNMIAAERDKKDSDQSKIDEWTEQINDNLKTIKENAENLLESAGGLGSDSNWQSAMQDFADAWVDAFNEGESTIDALNDSFNDLISNMVKKQLMLRVVSKMLEPLLKLIDDAVSEDSVGGLKVTKEELDTIKNKWAEIMPELNSSLESMVDMLDYSPTNSTELSALQQGIEGVTESTAEALESLLNSMRFFLATQQGDVAIIRQILEAQYGNPITTTVQTSQTQTTTETSSSNPMLVELKTQTGYLQRLSDNFEGCFTYNNTSSGKGLRVYVKGL